MSRPQNVALASWLVAGAVGAVLVGILSASLQLAGFAPLVLTSLLTGAALGALLVALAQFCGVLRSHGTLMRAGGLALVTVLTVHLWMYLDYRHEWHRTRQEHPALAVFSDETGPHSPTAFLIQEGSPRQIALWIGDAVLTTLATVILVGSLLKRIETGKQSDEQSPGNSPDQA